MNPDPQHPPPQRPPPRAPLVLHIDGIAFWSPALPGWAQAQAALRGEPGTAGARSAARPAPALLAANERRRAPDSVLLALQVAHDAVADSGHDARDLASIFTSAYGDLPIVDALCRTLAADPRLLSPTRFHHSVHNAASGYWAIASGSRAASSAVAAGGHSFAAGLLEAAAAVVADSTGMLLVGFDTEACGPLASVNRSRGLLGVALVLSPAAGARSRWRLSIDCENVPAAPRLASRTDSNADSKAVSATDRRSHADAAHGTSTHPAWQALRSNAHADALPLFEALARREPQQVVLALGRGLQLRARLDPVAADSAADASGMIPA